jgi:DNA mismatch endonuclease, patch repair protein
MAAKMRIQAPRFAKLQPASEESSRAKRASSAHSGTEPELLLRHALASRGLVFRENATDLPGKPDVVFDEARVVVFCDGDFWHGRNWRRLRVKLAAGTNAKYWIAKIKSNRARDRLNNKKLAKLDWLVLRFWETDVRSDANKTAEVVAERVVSRPKQ